MQQNALLVTLLLACRQTAPYSPAPDSDHILIERRLRHRTPSAWMSFALGAA